jgi:hypothetical protein
MDLILVDFPDDLVLPVLVPALVLVLVLVATWTLGIPGRVRSWWTGRKGRGKKIPSLDPIVSMSQVNYVVGLRAAGKIDDLTWEQIVPLVESYLRENPFPRMKDRVDSMFTWGERIRNGRG